MMYPNPYYPNPYYPTPTYQPPRPKPALPTWAIVLIAVVGCLGMIGLALIGQKVYHRLGIVHSQSYKQGYDAMRNADSRKWWSDVQPYGYTPRSACAMVEAFSMPKPADAGDWIQGCTDALHDKGIR
jgi:hypothetical protein